MQKGKYTRPDGVACVRTTSVLSAVHMGSIEGLLHWANRLGLEGKNHREERDKAADAGTVAHQLIENHIRGHSLDEVLKGKSESVAEKAWSGYEAYVSWQKQSKLDIIHAERQMAGPTFPSADTYDEQLWYGGTADGICRSGNEHFLLDFKTSNAFHTQYLLQVAAYGKLTTWCVPEIKKISGFHVLRLGKDEADFHHAFFRDLDMAWDAFVMCRQLYDMEKKLKKRL